MLIPSIWLVRNIRTTSPCSNLSVCRFICMCFVVHWRAAILHLRPSAKPQRSSLNRFFFFYNFLPHFWRWPLGWFLAQDFEVSLNYVELSLGEREPLHKIYNNWVVFCFLLKSASAQHSGSAAVGSSLVSCHALPSHVWPWSAIWRWLDVSLVALVAKHTKTLAVHSDMLSKNTNTLNLQARTGPPLAPGSETPLRGLRGTTRGRLGPPQVEHE